MKIVLVEPSDEKFHTERPYVSAKYTEPLALECLAAYLNPEGYDIKIIQQKDMPNNKLIKDILKETPDVIGFSPLTFSAPNTHILCKNIKAENQNIITVVGGYHASGYYQMVKDKNIDFAVIGEGEHTLLELIQKLEKKEDISTVKGIAYWDNELKITKPRTRIQNLDTLPFPYRPEEIISQYKNERGLVSYSRGCPFACSYCASPLIFGKQVRWRKPESIADEIKMLEEIGFKNVFFSDLTFNSNKQKIIELCNILNSRKISLYWQAQGNTRIDKDLLGLMKESGCNRYHFGIEAVSSDTLDIIGRKTNLAADLERTKDLLRYCDEIGIVSRAYLMVGYPEETEADYQKILSTLEYLLPDFPRITFFTPFPGTPVYDSYKKQGLLATEDFSKYTTNYPVVKTNLGREKIIELRGAVLKKFYSNRRYQAKIRNKLCEFPELGLEFEHFAKQKWF